MADKGAAFSKALESIARARGFKNVSAINRPVIGKGRGIAIRTLAGKYCVATLFAYSEAELTRIERDLWADGYHPRQRAQA